MTFGTAVRRDDPSDHPADDSLDGDTDDHDDDMDDDRCTMISDDMQAHTLWTRSMNDMADAIVDATSKESVSISLPW